MVKSDLFFLLQACTKPLLQGTIPDASLLAALASKVLGIAVVAGSALVKVPQILAVTRSHSAAGLNFSSFELENIGFSIHTAYGFIMGLPFSAYGEALLLLAQNSFLLACIYHYARASIFRALGMLLLTAAGGSWVLSGAVTPKLIGSAYELNNVIFTAARVPQIISNYHAKSTGQLNIVTFLMNVVGCCVRIFTTLQEGGGASMARGFVLGGVLNLILVLQILHYKSKGGSNSPQNQSSKKAA